jgi:hypothetical protein
VSFDFELPHAARVRLKVHDLQGRRVRMVEDALLRPGHYSRIWDGSGDAAPHRRGERSKIRRPAPFSRVEVIDLERSIALSHDRLVRATRPDWA